MGIIMAETYEHLEKRSNGQACTIARQIEEIEQLQAENKKLRKIVNHFMQCDCMCEHCDLARKALKE